jgi:hypothetical protein
VAEALGLSEATVRGWESKTDDALVAGLGPTEEQAVLLDKLFAGEVDNYEPGAVLRAWGWNEAADAPGGGEFLTVSAEAPDDGDSPLVPSDFTKHECDAERIHVFNYTLNAEVGILDEYHREVEPPWLAKEVFGNLREGKTTYQYLLAPAVWMPMETWLPYVCTQIKLFKVACANGPRFESQLHRVGFTLLATYADLPYSLDWHDVGGDITTWACEEIPDRGRLGEERVFFKLNDSRKLRSVLRWLVDVGREHGVRHDPSRGSLDDLEVEFRAKWQDYAVDWTPARRAIQDEVRAERAERAKGFG